LTSLAAEPTTRRENRSSITKGNQLILAVEFTATDDDLGGISAIDLDTGNRTLVSGKIKDPVLGDIVKAPASH